MRRVAIIGAGLAGLTVAFRAAQAGHHVTIFEALPRVGGQLLTEEVDGFVIEHGAEGFVAGSQAVPELAAALSVADAIVSQLVTKSYGFDGNTLIELAPGQAATFLGFQVPRGELGAGIRSFHAGMGQLTLALWRSIAGRVAMRGQAAAVRLSRPEGTSRIDPLEGASVEVDDVVIATSSAAAAALLEGDLGDAARALREAATLSSVTVSLAFPRDAIDHPLDATGFVVAGQSTGFRACTFTTSKLAGRAPEGYAVMRLFFRPSDEDLLRTDDSWVTYAAESLARVLRVRGAHERAWVSRWVRALPLFTPEHVARVKALEAALAPTAVRLAGSAFHGSGIDAAIRSAEAAAAALVAG